MPIQRKLDFIPAFIILVEVETREGEDAPPNGMTFIPKHWFLRKEEAVASLFEDRGNDAYLGTIEYGEEGQPTLRIIGSSAAKKATEEVDLSPEANLDPLTAQDEATEEISPALPAKDDPKVPIPELLHGGLVRCDDGEWGIVINKTVYDRQREDQDRLEKKFAAQSLELGNLTKELEELRKKPALTPIDQGLFIPFVGPVISVDLPSSGNAPTAPSPMMNLLNMENSPQFPFVISVREVCK
jgi:hypothetical protein